MSRLVCALALSSAITACGAEYSDEPPPNTPGTEPGPPGSDPNGPIEEPEQAAPADAPPAAPPGAPPSAPPPPPATASAPAAAPGPPATPPPPVTAAAPGTDTRPVYTPDSPQATGQWVYTNPYGWVWMPYEQSYTYVTPAEDSAYAYVYYPAVGWEWISAPWVIGIGPRPYWGRWGPAHFSWYARPWFRPHRVYYSRHPYYGGRGGHYGRGGYRRR